MTEPKREPESTGDEKSTLEVQMEEQRRKNIAPFEKAQDQLRKAHGENNKRVGTPDSSED